jgi:hypothetical protein
MLFNEFYVYKFLANASSPLCFQLISYTQGLRVASLVAGNSAFVTKNKK